MKTTQARSIPTRVTFTYMGTDTAPIAPIGATAYARGGKIVIATANVKDAPGIIEFRPTDRIRWSSQLAGTRGVYWCGKCPQKHARRISTTKYAATYCDVQDKALAAARRQQGKTYVPVRVTNAIAREQQRESAIDNVLTRPSATRDQMIANTLTNVWNSDLFATKEKRDARLAVLAAQYGMNWDQAVSRVGQGTTAVRRPVSV